jgi:predicted enzyme related to lactoylglutathione lyase
MSKRPIVHIEIPSNNHGKAKSFYNKLCGWDVEEVPFADDSIYTSFKTGNVDVALSDMDDNNQAGDVLIYFQSDDLDADIAQVKDLGGTVVLPRQDVDGFGSLGIFLDPMGNRVAFWQSNHPS